MAAQPVCEEDVQPSTWVEFSSAFKDTHRLAKLLEREGRAYVTFEGSLRGPAPVGPDDLALPSLLSYANRTRGRRYGHLGSFRTELVVEAVLDAQPVPTEIPRDLVWHEPSPVHTGQEVLSMEIPRYPEMARRAGIQGDVEIEVRLSAGKLLDAQVKSGDRILALEAVEDLKTWRFGGDASGLLSVRFSYKLERKKSQSKKESPIDLRLPFYVGITAPEYGW